MPFTRLVRSTALALCLAVLTAPTLAAPTRGIEIVAKDAAGKSASP